MADRVPLNENKKDIEQEHPQQIISTSVSDITVLVSDLKQYRATSFKKR
ncbi:MAG: hypothetical protein GY774_14480 [Planctomycetes bacterium]|nr:hypothetical protein [Planctomycetota bacterium]